MVVAAAAVACAMPTPSSNPVTADPWARPGAEVSATASAATVTLVLGGRRTLVNVYLPAQPNNAAVVLAHGFTRNRLTMAGHARMLARAGYVAIAPDLPYLVDSRDNARALGDLVAQLRRGAFSPVIERVVLVGFSAGGLAALLAAGSPGVVGYIGLDPFDRSSGIGRAFARELQLPAVLLRAPPSACNAYSIAAPWAIELPHLELDRVFDGATHCDFEAPTDLVCRLACGAADPARQRAIEDELLRTVQRWLAS
jgi:pimeloyl-ACP methyl ester carboxylesterase